MHSQSNRGSDKNAKKSSQKLSSKLIIEEQKNVIKSNPSAKKSEKRSAKESAKGSKKQSSKKISQSNDKLDPEDKKSKDKEMIELKCISLSFKKNSGVDGQNNQEQEIQEPAQQQLLDAKFNESGHIDKKDIPEIDEKDGSQEDKAKGA